MSSPSFLLHCLNHPFKICFRRQVRWRQPLLAFFDDGAERRAFGRPSQLPVRRMSPLAVGACPAATAPGVLLLRCAA